MVLQDLHIKEKKRRMRRRKIKEEKENSMAEIPGPTKGAPGPVDTES